MAMTLDTSRILMTAGLTAAAGKPAVAQSGKMVSPSLDLSRLVSTKGLTAAAGKPV